jgi:hypothetical protein
VRGDLSGYLIPLGPELLDADIAVQLGSVVCRRVTGSLRSDRPKWADHVRSLAGHDVDLSSDHPNSTNA